MEKNSFEALNFRDYLKIIKERFYILLITAFVGLFALLGLSYLKNDEYKASQSIYIQNLNIENQNGEIVIDSLRIIYTFKDFITDPVVTKSCVEKINATNLLSEQLDSKYYKNIIKGIEITSTSDTSICLNLAYTTSDEMLSKLVVENLILAAREASSQDKAFSLFKDCITTYSSEKLGSGNVCDIDIISPNKLLYSGIGLIGGAILGVILVFVVNAIDNTVRSEKYIKNTTSLKVIGRIPSFPKEKQ